MNDTINFLIALLKMRIKVTECYNSVQLNLLVVPLLLVFFSINISKKYFYTIIPTAPSPFIFIVNIKGKRQCIRDYFGSRGEAISTVSQ